MALTAFLLGYFVSKYACLVSGLLCLLSCSDLVEVLDHHAHEHVEHEEADQQQKRYEVQDSPLVVVLDWLKSKTNVRIIVGPRFDTPVDLSPCHDNSRIPSSWQDNTRIPSIFKDNCHFPSKTSRERHKSAPYLRLKHSKRTSKCQVFSFTIPENPKVAPNWRAEKPTLSDFSNISVAKHQKNWRWDPSKSFKNYENSTENLSFVIFQHSFYRKT